MLVGLIMLMVGIGLSLNSVVLGMILSIVGGTLTGISSHFFIQQKKRYSK
ncbi:hypothetical protein AAIE21_19215 [Paenibacillus sp. 102]